MLKLRDYQTACIEAINKDEEQGVRSLIAVDATGAGKTCIFSSLIAQRNQRALILAHTGELLQQIQEKLRVIAPEPSSGLVDHVEQNRESFVLSNLNASWRPTSLSKTNRLSKEDPLLLWVG